MVDILSFRITSSLILESDFSFMAPGSGSDPAATDVVVRRMLRADGAGRAASVNPRQPGVEQAVDGGRSLLPEQ